VFAGYCKLSDGDRKMSKHVAVYITQTDCCDIYCYGINCVFVGYNNQFKNVFRGVLRSRNSVEFIVTRYGLVTVRCLNPDWSTGYFALSETSE
jgi:Ethanolamine utilization protein EutJ (predicted chaperonin)